MSDAARPRRLFRPRLVPTLAAAAMLPVLLSLGTWQARRYQESTAKIAAYRAQHDGLPPLESLDVPPGADRNAHLHFRRAALAGKLDVARAQLLTARYKFGQRGWSVVAPLDVATGPYPRVLVLLGWVPHEHVDAWLARLAAEPRTVVRGRIQFVNGLSPDEKPVSQRDGRDVWFLPNPLAIAKRVAGLDPHVLVEAGEEASGKPVDPKQWPIVGYAFPVHPLPAKHVEYSLTWYLLALTLVAVWIALSLRKVDRDPPPSSAPTADSGSDARSDPVDG